MHLSILRLGYVCSDRVLTCCFPRLHANGGSTRGAAHLAPMTELTLIDAAKLNEPRVEQLRELTGPPLGRSGRDAHALAWHDSISTIKTAQPSTRPGLVTLAKSPATFADIRTMQTCSFHHDPI
jgi:hypothetical protein